MIARYLFVRLGIECRDRAAAIASTVRGSLGSQGQENRPVSFSVGLPSDAHAGKGWDLSIVLHFEDAASSSRFGGYDAPEAAVLSWAGPTATVQVVKAWHFDIAG